MMFAASSTWIKENQLSLIEKFAINVVKIGYIPKHVAFIMDGNRRFANKSQIDKKEGHAKGFEKLSETLQWCLDIGIKEVTVYAFSIENFKRSSDEVDSLMALAREKFQKLLEERNKLHERGIRINIIGNLNLLPNDILKSMTEAMLLTRYNKEAVLNVAFAYTSRDEMTNAVKVIAKHVKQGFVQSSEINQKYFEKCFYIDEFTEPDLLVRTSGEMRFSDFVTWQASASVVYFTKTLWPEFTLWHLLGAVLYYQKHRSVMNFVKNKLKYEDELSDTCQTSLNSIKECRFIQLEQYKNS